MRKCRHRDAALPRRSCACGRRFLCVGGESGEETSVGDVTAKKKIAVLGGGLGSLSTVYGLTSDPAWRDHYDITIYQMGWRLGGKGASGRNRAQNMRIEEHGLHIWMGFYQNA